MIDIPSGSSAVAMALQFRLQQTERMLKQQRNQLLNNSLNQLLQHALSTVPYYREQLDLTAADHNIAWDKFPILTRENIQQNTDRLRSEAPPKHHGKAYEFRSSGSTGRPIKTFSSDYAHIFWQALTVREQRWAGYDFSGKLATIKYHDPEKFRYPGAHQTSWGGAYNILGYEGRLLGLNSCEPIDGQYQWLCENQPDYLVTYPSNLQELARIHEEKRQPLHLKGISTLGENLSPETRTMVSSTLGCKISDIYSSQEVGYMALQCPRHDHYHVQSESCIIEILNDDDKPCRSGEMGRVVVTSLQNYIMPLLRYQIGDYAIPGRGCDCGIQLPVIERIVGRTRNLVTYPDGRKSWPSYNPMALMDLVPDARFQLEQTSRQEITVHIQTGVDLTPAIQQDMASIIQSAMGYAFTLSFAATDNIPRAPSGKFEEFVSRL